MHTQLEFDLKWLTDGHIYFHNVGVYRSYGTYHVQMWYALLLFGFLYIMLNLLKYNKKYPTVSPVGNTIPHGYLFKKENEALDESYRI